MLRSRIMLGNKVLCQNYEYFMTMNFLTKSYNLVIINYEKNLKSNKFKIKKTISFKFYKIKIK